MDWLNECICVPRWAYHLGHAFVGMFSAMVALLIVRAFERWRG